VWNPAARHRDWDAASVTETFPTIDLRRVVVAIFVSCGDKLLATTPPPRPTVLCKAEGSQKNRLKSPARPPLLAGQTGLRPAGRTIDRDNQMPLTSPHSALSAMK
jgi:hypothetical protein